MSDSRDVRKAGFLQGILLLLCIVLTVIGIAVFTATVTQMQEHFRYATFMGSATLLGSPTGDYLVNLMQTMPGIWIVLLSPLAGVLADRFGRRRIVIWAMLLYGVFGIAPFFMNDIYAIIATRCVVGMCEAVVMTGTTTLLCDYFKGATRERWLAGQTAVATLASLIIIPLGGLLGAKFGWQGPFLVYLYSPILVIFVAMFCWEPAREISTEAEQTQDSDGYYLRLPKLRLTGILLITVIASMMFYATVTQNANAFLALGVRDPADVGRYSMLAALGVPIGTLLFMKMSRWNVGLLLCIEFLVIGLGFSGMAASTTPVEYVLATNVQQIGCGLILPTMLVWATRGLAYQIRGRGNGLWQGAFAVGMFLSGASLTFLGKQLGGLLVAFGALGKFCLVAALVAIVTKLIWGRSARGVAGVNVSG